MCWKNMKHAKSQVSHQPEWKYQTTSNSKKNYLQMFHVPWSCWFVTEPQHAHMPCPCTLPSNSSAFPDRCARSPELLSAHFFRSDASRIQPSRHPGSSRPNVATHSWDPSSQPFQVLLGLMRHRDAPQIRLASVISIHLYLSWLCTQQPNHNANFQIWHYMELFHILHSH